MLKKLFFTTVLIALSACASKPLTKEKLREFDSIAIYVDLGDQANAAVAGTTINYAERFFVEAYGLNSYFEKILQKILEEKKWNVQKDLTAQLLATAKEKKGQAIIKISPNFDVDPDAAAYSLSMGVLCFDSVFKKTSATPYFKFNIELIDPSVSKKTVFRSAVSPKTTENTPFAECSVLRDKIRKKSWGELVGPMKQALDLIAPMIVKDMGF